MSLDNLTTTERNQWFLLGQSVRRGVRKEEHVAVANVNEEEDGEEA